MTLRNRVAHLDDASGELALSLAKLEMEAARGVPSTDEQIDFLHDLHRAAYHKEILPWRSRCIQAAAAGAALAIIALFLPPATPFREIVFPATAALAGLTFLGAAACLGIYTRNLRRARRWLRCQETAALEGKLLLDGR
jgi:hypothetical protein